MNAIVNVVESNTAILQLPQETESLIKASIAENTLKAYQLALQSLTVWLSGRVLSDALLANYITALHEAGKSAATIGQVVAAVKWQLKHQSQETVNFPITQATLAGIRREGKDRGRGQVDGLIWQDVERVCIYAKTQGTLAGLRDAAIIRLMSDCLLRISEVAAVNVGDLKENTLTVRASKTDQEGAGETLYVCDKIRQLLKQYTEQADITRDALFRHIRRGDHIQSNRLNPHSARRIIKKRAADAGVEGFISGHSLRVGSAVSLAQAGATVVDMQVAGRWKSSQMPAHYAKAELAERGAIARFKDGKTR
jgi:site-specific recombinase XerD